MTHYWRANRMLKFQQIDQWATSLIIIQFRNKLIYLIQTFCPKNNFNWVPPGMDVQTDMQCYRNPVFMHIVQIC